MKKIVTKFGGSSLCDSQHFQQVKDILMMDPGRKYVVPSAPGKRFDGDSKVTDLLYSCWEKREKGEDFNDTFDVIAGRFMDICEELHLSVDIGGVLDEILQNMTNGASKDYCASRGEYLNGILLASFLGWRFMDAAKVVFFDKEGNLDSEKTNVITMALLADGQPTVVPGFYGVNQSGEIHTFSRGGSDITGAVVARAVRADVYENWTDVSGFLMADPHIVKNPRGISSITYAELRELSYMGASVLHEDAMFPVHKAGIPTIIRNTNSPENPGTLISLNPLPKDSSSPIITGIAGHQNFSVVSIEKAMMNAELGFGRKVLQVFEEYGLSFEHMPSGIDSLCVVVSGEHLAEHREEIVYRLADIVSPDALTIHDHMSLIATVGRGMVNNCGTAARLFSALSRAGINVRMIDQGSSELSIIVGVDDSDFKDAIRAIYQEFVG